jgi:hypothetical protein
MRCPRLCEGQVVPLPPGIQRRCHHDRSHGVVIDPPSTPEVVILDDNNE